MSTKLTNLPKGWQWKEIGSFCETASGGTPSRARQDYFKGDIPWVKIGDMRNWEISETEERISKIGLENSSAKVFPKGTVLVSIFATIGAVSILNIEATTNQAIAGITPDPKVANSKYLAYCLLNIRPEMEAMSRGVAQKNINQKILRSIQVAIPPLNVQSDIIDVLDKTRALQQKREQTNQMANNILQAVFIQMFEPYLGKENDWTKKLEAVCEKVIDIEHKMPKSVENGVPFISAKDISGDEIDFEHCKYIAQEDHERLCRRCNPKIGDILYSRIGVKLGIARLVKVNKDFNISYSLCMIRPNSQIVNARYLTYFLNSELGRSQAKKETQSIAVPDLGMKAIKDFRIVVPPIELQNDFANICSKVESLKEKQRTCTEETSELFNSLMSKAFKGELVS